MLKRVGGIYRMLAVCADTIDCSTKQNIHCNRTLTAGGAPCTSVCYLERETAVFYIILLYFEFWI